MGIVPMDIEWIKCVIVAYTTWLMAGDETREREPYWLLLLGD